MSSSIILAIIWLSVLSSSFGVSDGSKGYVLDPEQSIIPPCSGAWYRIEAGRSNRTDPVPVPLSRLLNIDFRSDCKLPCSEDITDRSNLPTYLRDSHFRLTLLIAGPFIRPIQTWAMNHSIDCQAELKSFGQWRSLVYRFPADLPSDAQFHFALDARFQNKNWALRLHLQ